MHAHSHLYPHTQTHRHTQTYHALYAYMHQTLQLHLSYVCVKVRYVCTKCGFEHIQRLGQCKECGGRACLEQRQVRSTEIGECGLQGFNVLMQRVSMWCEWPAGSVHVCLSPAHTGKSLKSKLRNLHFLSVAPRIISQLYMQFCAQAIISTSSQHSQHTHLNSRGVQAPSAICACMFVHTHKM
jgi:hypothetical protein